MPSTRQTELREEAEQWAGDLREWAAEARCPSNEDVFVRLSQGDAAELATLLDSLSAALERAYAAGVASERARCVGVVTKHARHERKNAKEWPKSSYLSNRARLAESIAAALLSPTPTPEAKETTDGN